MARNIERMIQFYSTYKDDEIATPLVTQLSIKNNYSKRELDRQITSSYYERIYI